jgi:NADH dehydrogenase
MDNKREKVYIVGNGWASFYFCKNVDKTKYEPIIIAPNNKVLNTTKLIKYVFDSSTNVEFENPYAEVINSSLIDIDYENKQLKLSNDEKISYDKNIVLAIGSEVNYYGIEGCKENSFSLKTLQDAIVLNNKLKNIGSELYRHDNGFNINVIGSGPTGIEFCAELSCLKKNTFLKNFPFTRLNLIEAMNEILPGFTNKTKTQIENHLMDVNIYKKYPVNKICNNKVITSIDIFKSDLTIWTGGVKFNGYEQTTLYHTLNNLLNEKNKITPRGIAVNDNFAIDSDKLIKSTTNIYCLGDMVANKGPPTAQNAKHQAQWLALYFNNKMDANRIEPYKIKSYGKVLHLKNKIYIESDYYTGFMPQWMDTMIEFFY